MAIHHHQCLFGTRHSRAGADAVTQREEVRIFNHERSEGEIRSIPGETDRSVDDRDRRTGRQVIHEGLNCICEGEKG